jgi:SAM-dependent methyltransferase
MLLIPDKAVKYILFQRTAYLIYQNNKILNKIAIHLPFYTYNRAVLFEACLFKNRIKRLFSEDMEREYENIREHLPERPRSILDIGCGVAGIDIMLARHYAEKGIYPDLYLLDKSELDDKVYYGIEKVASYYNSLDVARGLLEANGAKPDKIHSQEVTGAPVFPGVDFDLVISLISWGFHYPVSTYLDEVHKRLRPGGRLIIDIRKGQGGEQLVEGKFGSIKIIGEFQKHVRVLAVKQ